MKAAIIAAFVALTAVGTAGAAAFCVVPTMSPSERPRQQTEPADRPADSTPGAALRCDELSEPPAFAEPRVTEC
jgi:hypothetical protein